MQICSCRLMYNVIGKTSKDCQEVTANIIYFKEPTVQFFQNGKKVAEAIGDDEVLVRKTFVYLYRIFISCVTTRRYTDEGSVKLSDYGLCSDVVSVPTYIFARVSSCLLKIVGGGGSPHFFSPGLPRGFVEFF